VAAVLAVAALPHLVVEPRGVTEARAVTGARAETAPRVTVAPAAKAELVTEAHAEMAPHVMVALDGTTRLSGAALTVVRDEMAKGPRAPVVMLLVPALVARTGRLLGVGLG
jgi:hypothetical protein